MTDNLEYRINELEDDVKEVCGDVKLIMRNHLPHIQNDITDIKTTLKLWTWLYGIIIVGIVGAILKLVLV